MNYFSMLENVSLMREDMKEMADKLTNIEKSVKDGLVDKMLPCSVIEVLTTGENLFVFINQSVSQNHKYKSANVPFWS